MREKGFFCLRYSCFSQDGVLSVQLNGSTESFDEFLAKYRSASRQLGFTRWGDFEEMGGLGGAREDFELLIERESFSMLRNLRISLSGFPGD